ncbi:hypothetical protein EDB83DRAFT_2320282 [Lactarius deliciosus]|nr:hypothetical protein EDB83DRAFT_2320282 [Lactarius deliciosus]
MTDCLSNTEFGLQLPEGALLAKRMRILILRWPEQLVGGPWIATLGLPLRCCPLMTLGRPPPTTIVELQRGEPHSCAFGTGMRIAGSISSGPVLLPLVLVREEEGGAGQEWQACPSLSPYCGAMLDTYTLSVIVVELPNGPHIWAGAPWSPLCL